MEYSFGLLLVAALLVALVWIRHSLRQRQLRRRLQAGHRPRPNDKLSWTTDRAEMRAFEHTTTVLDSIRKPPTQPGGSGQGRATDSRRGADRPTRTRR